MRDHQDVSRRRFIKGTAGAAAVPATILAAGKSAAAASNVNVVATVVRATHSRSNPRTLRIGVRAAVQTPDLALDNLVLLVESVPFTASARETGDLIAASVRSQVAAQLERRGVATRETDIAVRVFGGVL